MSADTAQHILAMPLLDGAHIRYRECLHSKLSLEYQTAPCITSYLAGDVNELYFWRCALY